jgi:hypothetical protein
MGCSHRDRDGYFSAFDAGTVADSQRVYLSAARASRASGRSNSGEAAHEGGLNLG